MGGMGRYSAATLEATRLLGGRIRLARHARHWSLDELAGRVGVTRKTMLKVERGDPSVGLGVAFEAARLTGVPLFDPDPARRAAEAESVRRQLALLPTRAQPLPDVDDDF